MAERTVSVRLKADATPLVREMAKGAAAARALGDSAAQANRSVGASSDDAARKIAEVRNRLVDLGRTQVNARAGVDTVAARMELAELHSALQQIDRSNPSARVDAETAPAEALLARLDSYGESESIVDPELLGEVTEIRRREWRATFPKPVCGVLASIGQLVWTTPDRVELA